MKHLLFRGHLGLGDHLVTNAIVRHCARENHVFVLAKQHNVMSLNFMFRDLRNVEILSINDDAEADEFVEIVKAKDIPVLGLGFYGPKPFDPKHWDREMYRQAGMEFQQRWNGFVVHRQPSRELPHPSGPFVLVHDDAARGFAIDPKRLPQDCKIVRIEPGKTDCLFDWWGHMEEAVEIHMIDSSPAILVDSLPVVKAERLYLHDYARPNGLPPSFCKNWIRLK